MKKIVFFTSIAMLLSSCALLQSPQVVCGVADLISACLYDASVAIRPPMRYSKNSHVRPVRK